MPLCQSWAWRMSGWKSSSGSARSARPGRRSRTARIHLRQAVDIGPAKVILVVHEVPECRSSPAFQCRTIDGASPAGTLKVAHMGQLFRPFLRNGTVQGQQYPHIVALRGQHGRQRAHVRQTTGYKGNTLGCRKEDFASSPCRNDEKGRRDILFSFATIKMTTFFAITMG